MAQKEGEFIIPSIPISTASGTLSTQPIRVKVFPRNPHKPQDEISGLSLNATVTKTTPFKNEPFILNVKLIAKNQDIANLSLEKFSIEDALSEPIGEPQVITDIQNGIKAHTVVFSFLITPLKTGKLKIPALILTGATPSKREGKSSLFDDDFDSFLSFSPFQRMRPFSLNSNEIELTVRPPAIPNMDPWLPSESFALEEIWGDLHNLKVGEPIERTVILKATGIAASQLPSLQNKMVRDIESEVKIYADKPQTNDQVIHDTIQSQRTERFTLMAQRPGDITFPPIKLTWWNVTKNREEVVELPSKTLSFLPALKTEQEEQTQKVGEPIPSPETSVTHRDPLLYILLSVFIAILFVGGIYVVTLQRRLQSLTSKTTSSLVKTEAAKPKHLPKPPKKVEKKKPEKKDKNEKLPDLNPT